MDMQSVIDVGAACFAPFNFERLGLPPGVSREMDSAIVVIQCPLAGHFKAKKSSACGVLNAVS
jgi:hypothetical protein